MSRVLIAAWRPGNPRLHLLAQDLKVKQPQFCFCLYHLLFLFCVQIAMQLLSSLLNDSHVTVCVQKGKVGVNLQPLGTRKIGLFLNNHHYTQ